MDFSGRPPLKQHEDFGIQEQWSPVTPAKNNPTRQLVSSPTYYNQRNQLSEPSWLDLVTGAQNTTPPWGIPCFQNGVPEASTSRATISSFMPHSAASNNGNAVLMNHWSPFFAKNGNCQVLPSSPNQLLLNGKVLLPQSCCNRSGNWAGQNAQYGSTITCPPNLNSFPESSMSFAGMPGLQNNMNPEFYSQRMHHKEQSLNVINLVNEHAREENLLMKMSSEASFSNLMASSESVCFQNPDCIKDLAVLSGEISYQLTGMEKSLVEGENERTDLDDASKVKSRRKKHRPKVIIEGKPARTPKLGTPKQKTPKAARDKESASGKRKYTRRKKDSTPCPDTKALGEIGDAESRSGSKSVRRSLNFDSEESQTGDKFSYLMSMFMQTLENHEHETWEDSNLASSRLKETVHSTLGQGPIVENSLSGIVFDLKSSTNEPPNGYLKILQASPSTNNVNSNGVFDTPSKGTKRDHCVIDEAWGLENKNLIHSFNSGDFSSNNHGAERQGSCLPVINKKMRIENGCKGSTCSPSPILTYSPSTGWQAIQAPNNSQELTFTDTMKLISQDQLQSLERVLLGEHADVNTHIYPVQSSNLRSIIELMDYNRNSTPVKPPWQRNNDIRPPPTPEKPSGYSNSQESKIGGTMVQFETSDDVNKPVKVKGRRGRKKKEENLLINPCSSPSNTGALPNVISFNHQVSRNYKASANSSITYLSPYMNFMDDIVQKLMLLSIDGENAIVPYVRNGGAMVPYEGTFELAKRRRPRAKVDLDPETNRVWKLLMGIEGEGNERANEDKEMWWEEERQVFRGRVDSFIARMHLVQGDRRFSQWKGSVVDSVIGVFLTQNVSDHLSSSAFMALASKFPLRSGGNSRENQTEGITSLTGTPNLQKNILNHHFSSQFSSEINATENDGKKENSNSNETLTSGTGSSSVVSYEGKVFESHETELSFGHESPNSGSNTAVTVAISINSAEIEDRKLVEEVFSSQNSGVASQNSIGCQVLSSDHIITSSMLNIEADDLLFGSLNNGFGHPSFTELLHIAESDNFPEFYSHGNMPSENSQVVHKIGNDLHVLDHIDNSKGTCQPYQADFASHQALFGLPDMFPEAEFFSSPNPTNFTNLKNNATGEIVTGNKFEVNHGECGGPEAENLANSSSFNKPLLIDSFVPTRIPSAEESTSLETEAGFNQKSSSDRKLAERTNASSNIENSHGNTNIQAKDMAKFQQKAEISQEAIRVQGQMENYTSQKNCSTNKLDMDQRVGSIMKGEAYNSQNVSTETPKKGEKARRTRAESEKKTFDWDSLRKEVNRNKSTEKRSSSAMDSLDWEAVRRADVSEIAETIRERGMNNMLAERIKDFLNRLVREHERIDLEWLRDVPPDKSKDFLLSVRGLGLKSAECVRLLTLHHLAFPVDTNVGRICVRLGWVPLQPLPESLQLHLLELYPVLETIQKYLWPRLCKLDQRTLYELHYQMITFGKVFCTKSKPNCNSCPMRGECRHFASAFASARLALPPPEDKIIVSSTHSIASEHGMTPAFTPSSIPRLECCSISQELTIQKNSEPIIEEPETPEPECPETLESEIEDAFFEDPDEIPMIKLNFEKFTENLQNYMRDNMELQSAEMSNALVALTPEAASIPMPKLKNISRLRTEHHVYEIPDSHPLLEGLEQREPDDPCPYLLAIWTPGETAQSTEPPKACCDSQDTGKLCDRSTCFACNCIRESQAHTVRGTLLIPCRTAMRGSFPLNGTYFQVNEVFADHHTSRNPIDIPTDWIWNLPRRTVCFGTSIPTIFRGLTTEGIQQCFWRGFVCVRGFDRVTRAPKPLYARLHFPASKAPKHSRGVKLAAAND